MSEPIIDITKEEGGPLYFDTESPEAFELRFKNQKRVQEMINNGELVGLDIEERLEKISETLFTGASSVKGYPISQYRNISASFIYKGERVYYPDPIVIENSLEVFFRHVDGLYQSIRDISDPAERAKAAGRFLGYVYTIGFYSHIYPDANKQRMTLLCASYAHELVTPMTLSEQDLLSPPSASTGSAISDSKSSSYSEVPDHLRSLANIIIEAEKTDLSSPGIVSSTIMKMLPQRIRSYFLKDNISEAEIDSLMRESEIINWYKFQDRIGVDNKKNHLQRLLSFFYDYMTSTSGMLLTERWVLYGESSFVSEDPLESDIWSFARNQYERFEGYFVTDYRDYLRIKRIDSPSVELTDTERDKILVPIYMVLRSLLDEGGSEEEAFNSLGIKGLEEYRAFRHSLISSAFLGGKTTLKLNKYVTAGYEEKSQTEMYDDFDRCIRLLMRYIVDNEILSKLFRVFVDMRSANPNAIASRMLDILEEDGSIPLVLEPQKRYGKNCGYVKLSSEEGEIDAIYFDAKAIVTPYEILHEVFAYILFTQLRYVISQLGLDKFDYLKSDLKRIQKQLCIIYPEYSLLLGLFDKLTVKATKRI